MLKLSHSFGPGYKPGYGERVSHLWQEVSRCRSLAEMVVGEGCVVDRQRLLFSDNAAMFVNNAMKCPLGESGFRQPFIK
jgi:hypothetical protein